MKAAQPTQDLRLTSSLWISVLGWIGLGILFIDLIAGQQWDLLFAYAPGLGVAAWVLYFFFFAPKIRVGGAQVEVRNVWTTTRIPYSKVDDITIGLLVKIHYRDRNETARQITSWNAPGLPGPIRGSRGASQISGYGSAASSDQISPSQVLVHTWQRPTDAEDDQVTRKFHWPDLVILAVLIVLALLPKG